MNNRRKKERAGFILACILPAIILFLTFLIYPTIEVFRMSMYRWGGFSKNKQFVGFDNFVTLWKDENFSRTIQNTILLIVIDFWNYARINWSLWNSAICICYK